MLDKLPQEYKELIAEALQDPVKFMEQLLVDFTSKEKPPFIPNYAQKEILASKKKQTWVCVHRRAGKALPLDALVAIPSGFKEIGKLNVGDYVLNPDGKRVQITKTIDQANLQMVRFSLSNGQVIESCVDHLWQVYSDDCGYEVLSSQEILDTLSKDYKIDPIQPADHNYLHVPLDAYSYGRDCALSQSPLHKLYLYNAVEIRKKLVTGLMDFNGYSTNEKNRFESTNLNLALDFVILVQGLGCVAKILANPDGFIVEFKAPQSLELYTKISKKKAVYHSKDKLRIGIVSAEYTDIKPGRCLELNSNDHLFLTNYYLTTHNCITGDNLVIDPNTLKPTPIEQLSYAEETLVYDFTINKVVWSNSNWSEEGYKRCNLITLNDGTKLGLSTDHRVFTRKRGWVRCEELNYNDELLAPENLNIFGNKTLSDLDFAWKENFEKGKDSIVIPDEIFLLDKQNLIEWFRHYWEEFGRVLEDYDILLLHSPDRQNSEYLKHLLLRLGVHCSIEADANLIITDPTDRTLFLNTLGYNIEVLEVHAPRMWVGIKYIKDLGMRKVYDLSVNHQDHNFLANDIVVHNSMIAMGTACYKACEKSGQRIHVFCNSDKQRQELLGYVDGFVRSSPFLRIVKSKSGNSNSAPVKRTFINGSSITFHVLGTADLKTVLEGIRGITADVVILDEAQEYRDEVWRVLLPIMIGNKYQVGDKEVKTYVFGTIIKPVGRYYDTIYKGKGDPSTTQVVFIPFDKNPEITDVYREQTRLEVDDDDKYNTEYLLKPITVNTAVFRQGDVERGFAHDYEYGYHLIDVNKFRFIGVDWDKVQAGTNIVIGQVCPITNILQIIWREEIKKEKFTYTYATERVLELWEEYRCHGAAVDRGHGEMQGEVIMQEGARRGLDTLNSFLHVYMHEVMEVPDPASGDLVKVYTKDFIVGQTKRRFENSTIMFSGEDKQAKEQFFDYEIKKDNGKRKTYVSKNEHIIDCVGYINLLIYTLFDNFEEYDYSESHASDTFIQTEPSSYFRSKQDVWKSQNPQYDNFAGYYNKGLNDF